MSKIKIITYIAVFAVISALLILFFFRKKENAAEFSIRYPFNNALFPPEFPAPEFEWITKRKDTTRWEVTLAANNGKYTVKALTNLKVWSPTESEWDSLKLLSDYGRIYFRVRKSDSASSSKKITFRISLDSVGAPVLYN